MLNVLLIDDDDDDRFLFNKALQKTKLGIHLIEADCCDAALHLMDRSICPDIIFLDINMPEGNGYECLEQIRAKADWSRVPIIICTTSGNPDDLQKALGAKVEGFLKKPSDVTVLSQNLLQILDSL